MKKYYKLDTIGICNEKVPSDIGGMIRVLNRQITAIIVLLEVTNIAFSEDLYDTIPDKMKSYFIETTLNDPTS
jgi:hypothetical protein